MSGFGVFWRVFGVPDYHFTALDPYGQETTGQFSADDSDAAAERVKEMGLFATEISERDPRKETPPGPLGKYWDGTIGDAFQWFMWGVCIPVAPIFAPETDFHPPGGYFVAAGIGLVMITIRLRRVSGLRAVRAQDNPTSDSSNPALSPLS